MYFDGCFCIKILRASALDQDQEVSLGVLASNHNRIDLHEKASDIGVFSFNFNEHSTIDEEAKLVRNVWTVKHHKWVNLESVPIPKVFYDFGFFSRKRKELKQQGRNLREKIISLGSVPINSPTAMTVVRDKLKFSSMMEECHVQHPHTQAYSDGELVNFCDEHQYTFLKPVRGSKGNGIIEIKKFLDIYMISYQVKNGDNWIRKKNQSTKGRLVKNVQLAMRELSEKSKPYLMQEGISVLHFDDQRTDFRVSTHRNGDGEVEVVSMVVRVGGNVSQEGKIASDDEVLKFFEDEYGIEPKNLKKRLHSLALTVFKSIERKSEAPVGELGLDLIVDKQGEVYIIEANDKPGYKTPEIGRFLSQQAYRHSAKGSEKRNLRILEYARFLSTTNEI